MSPAARISVAAVAMGLCVATGCSSSAPPVAHGTAVTSPSPAPTAPPAVSLAALRRLHWTTLAADPLAPRDAAITAWTGHEFLGVGGQRSSDGAAFRGADAYDPQSGQWQLLPSFPLAARGAPASAWTGYGLVWGGSSTPGGRPEAGHALSDGAIFDATHRRWTVLARGPLPALTGPVAVTDAADQVIIMGGQVQNPAGSSDGSPLISRLVASYDPAAGTWRALPPLPAVRDHDLVEVGAVRWGARILVAQTWQHIVHTGPGSIEGSGGVDLSLLDPGNGRWSPFRVPHRSRWWVPICVLWAPCWRSAAARCARRGRRVRPCSIQPLPSLTPAARHSTGLRSHLSNCEPRPSSATATS